MQQVLLKLLMDLLGKFITPELVAQFEQQVVCWLKSQVANTSNEIDDAVVAIIAKALNVDTSKCP